MIINDVQGSERLNITPCDGSKYVGSLMKDEYLLLKFSLSTPSYFKLGDYVETENNYFEVNDAVFPKINESTGGYDYELRLDAHYWKWKHKILFYDRQNSKEAKWSLTRSPEAHMSIITSNLASLGYTYKRKAYVFSIDGTVKSDAIFIEYDSTNIIDALTKIAEACECEWWIRENYIFLGKCIISSLQAVKLEVNEEIRDPSRQESTATHATRIIAFGSTKNITTNYRPSSDDIISEGVVEKRLKLPAGTSYIDAYEGMTEQEAIETVVIFDDIFPRMTSTINTVTEREGTLENEDGTISKYPIYQIKVDALKNFGANYVLDELKLAFQTGMLSGFHFALTRISSDDTGTVFEIVRNENYGLFLPNDTLKPSVNDTFVLYGYDISFVSDTLIGEAEKELKTAAEKYVDDVKKDNSAYTVRTNKVRCAGYINKVYNKANEIDLSFGRKINFINPAYFEGSRESRVIGFEKDLNNVFDATYTIGEAAPYSRIGELENKISSLKYNGNTYVSNQGGSGYYLIKTNDNTVPTDQNVFSSLRTLAEIKGSLIEANGMFLRKDIDDTAYGVISHDKQVKSTIYVEGWEGKGWQISSSGYGEFDSLRVRSDIYSNGNIGSPTFASGFAGWGINIDMQKASAEMDNLFVRKTFTVHELVYSQVYGLGGSMITSDLNKIASVTEMADRYRCFMDSMDDLMMMNLRKGDGIRIQRKTLEGGIKYIFSRCLGVTSTYFDMQKPIIAGSGAPETGNFAFRWGNNEDTDRQGLIYQTSSDSGAPFIDVYDGITDESTEGCLKARLGKLSGIRTQNGEQLAGYGAYLNGIYIENSQVILDGGDTIEQRFVAMNGKLDSQINGIRQDMSEETGNLLKNSSFSENTHYWDSTSVASFINVEGAYLWQLGAFYIEKTKISDIVTDGNRKVLRVRNNFISQPNRLLKLDGFEWEKTESVTDPDTGVTEDQLVRQKYTFSVAFMYKVIRPGTLKVGFANSDLFEEIFLNESSNYLKYSKAGKWDGLGDFTIEFTGEIRIYGVSLFNDELADATIKLWTQIYQDQEQIALRATKEYVDAETGEIYKHYDTELKLTAEQISAQATRVDNIANTIATAGWITTADGNKIWASQSGVNALGQRVTTAESSITQNANAIDQKVSSTDFNGNTIASKINQTSTNVSILASKINLNGAVTFSAFDTTLNNRFATAEDNASNALQRVNAIPSWAKQTQMQQAMMDQGLIVGGYMKMSLIDVNNLYCKHLDAATGSMGGFDVQNGGIFSTSYNTGQSNTKFSLYSSGTDGFLAFTATNIWAGIGVNCLPAFSGLRALGRFENWVNSPYTDNYGIVIDVRNGYHNTALVAKGGIQLRGGFSAMESVKFIDYSNGGGSDSIQNWCLYYNQFCIKNRTSYMSMYLPRLKSGQTGEISGDDPGFILDIVIEHTSTYQVNLCVGDANTFIKDHNGNIVADNGNGSSYGNVNLGVGDSIRLLYKNQVYYILNRNN